MNSIICVSSDNATIAIPITLVLWGFVITFVIHIMEETIVPEVFVEKIKRLHWPQYSWKRFFWFNTILLLLNITSVIIYESLGGMWIIFPLSLACERVFNGLYHLGETIYFKKFSSGLLASVITWILAYLIVRYYILTGEITMVQTGISLIMGLSLALLMIVPLLTGKWKELIK
jgi:hypothetical protein